ncbi:MAG: FAD-dependent oxidoreductase [Gemmatimonadales bacterium]
MRFKRSFTEPVPKQREDSFARAGIAAFHGRARFVGPTAVRVGEELLEARHVVIATGAIPARLGIPGEEHLVTSDQFLDLDELPRRIAFVGGGYISFEFAHLAARAGAEVTVLHRDPRPLAGFDPNLVDQLVQKSRAVGIDVQLNTEVEGIERTATGFTVRTSSGDARHALTADLAVHGAGRVPEIDDLDLQAAGVDRGPRGIKVNEFLQSASNPAVYAAGDAAQSGGPSLTRWQATRGRLSPPTCSRGIISSPTMLASRPWSLRFHPWHRLACTNKRPARRTCGFA